MPPKKNKKPSKNGFWQFVLECRDKNPNKSMQEAQSYAAKKWANMSKEERKPYEDLAALARDTFHPVRLTSDGLEIDEVERQQKEAEERIQQMKNEIASNFKAAALRGILDEERFILIHINHLTHYPAHDKYFICEIALACVSLKNGIENMFHRIVKPGKLPLGFYGPAQAHSKETHQMIELVQEEPYEDNTEHVFFDVIAFLKQYSRSNKLPIVYADEKTFEMTNNVMLNFCHDFGFTEEIKVYNMQYMFFALKNAAAGKTVWPTETFSYNEIEKDVYCYCPNIGCEFHEMADSCTYCSKSIITRYAYTICDNCCVELNIQPIPGCHVPEKARVTNDSAKFGSKSTSMTSIDEISVQRGRVSSVSSQGYEDNFPPLGSSRSGASSVVSFSSMRTPRSRNAALTTRNVAVHEQLFESGPAKNTNKRDHKKLNFPKHGASAQFNHEITDEF